MALAVVKGETSGMLSSNQMDESNLRTSVIIEVENKDKPEEQSMFQIDFEGGEPPKEYEIDEVFCGDNVTVYALFEINDIEEGKYNKKLMEVTDSVVNEALSVYNKKPSKKESRRKKAVEVQTDESLFCLKCVKKNEFHEDFKVLYRKDMMPIRTKSSKFKSLSKGVNTDIVQCPQLLEEVYKAINMESSGIVFDEKVTEIASFSSNKPSYGLFEINNYQNLFSLETDSDCQKTSPKFLLVPVLITENGTVYYIKKEERTKEFAKTSQGVNTDETELFEQMKDVMFESQEQNVKETLSVEKPTAKINSNKDIILQEIKNMQMKLNMLIKSLENNDLETKSSTFTQESCETETMILEKKEPKVMDSFFMEAEPFKTTEKKCKNLPLYCPRSYSISQEQKNKKYNEEEKKEEMMSDTLTEWTDSIVSFKNCNAIVSEELKGLRADWYEHRFKNKSILSKSESKCISIDPKASLRRSMSLNLLYTGTKKIKNFKMDSVKAKTGRVLQSMESTPVDNKIVNIGDEVVGKPKSRADLEKVEVVSKSREAQPNKEGDAKPAYQQVAESLVNSENLTVHFCSAVANANELFNRNKSVSSIEIEPRNPIKSTNFIETKTRDNSLCFSKEEKSLDLVTSKIHDQSLSSRETGSRNKNLSTINFEISYKGTCCLEKQVTSSYEHKIREKNSCLKEPERRDKSSSPISFEIGDKSFNTFRGDKNGFKPEQRDKSSSPVNWEVRDKSFSPTLFEITSKGSNPLELEKEDKNLSPISFEISNRRSRSFKIQGKKSFLPEKRDKSSSPVNWKVRDRNFSPISVEIIGKSSNPPELERRDKGLNPITYEIISQISTPVESKIRNKSLSPVEEKFRVSEKISDRRIKTSDLEKSTTKEGLKRSLTNYNSKKESKPFKKSAEKQLKQETTKTKLLSAERKSIIKGVTEIKLPLEKLNKKPENAKIKTDDTKICRPTSQRKKRIPLNKEPSKVLVKVELHKTPHPTAEEINTKDLNADIQTARRISEDMSVFGCCRLISKHSSAENGRAGKW